MIDETNNFGYGPEDFRGSDYMDPDEERRYIEQQRESRERDKQQVTTQPAFGLMGEGELMDTCGALYQKVKNAEHRADFLQDLANSHEQGMLERQGKIEALEKEQDALLSTVAGLDSEVRRLRNKVNQLVQQKQPRKEVVDYKHVCDDLMRDYSIAVIEYGQESDEAVAIEAEIQSQAHFNPHVQQEITFDEHGRLRFRKNHLIERLVNEAGNGQGLNYICSFSSSVEDQAQLAQLIGYSVDGYQSLSYSLPIEEDKIPTKQEGNKST